MNHQAVCATLSCTHSRIIQNLDDIYHHTGHHMVPFAEFKQQILTNESLKVLQTDQKCLSNLFTDLTTYIELKLLKLKEQINLRVDAKIEEVFKLIEKDDLVSLIDNQKGLQYLLEFSTSSTQDKILKAYIQRVQYIFGKVRLLFKELKLDTDIDSKKDLIIEKIQQEKKLQVKPEKPMGFPENIFKQNLNGDYQWNETSQDFVLKKVRKIDSVSFVKEIEAKKNITRFIVDLRQTNKIIFASATDINSDRLKYVCKALISHKQSLQEFNLSLVQCQFLIDFAKSNRNKLSLGDIQHHKRNVVNQSFQINLKVTLYTYIIFFQQHIYLNTQRAYTFIEGINLLGFLHAIIEVPKFKINNFNSKTQISNIEELANSLKVFVNLSTFRLLIKKQAIRISPQSKN